MKRNFILCLILVLLGNVQVNWSQDLEIPDEDLNKETTIDERSYSLGLLGGFSEVVRLGIKTLALSQVMLPEKMDALMDDAAIIAQRNDVLMWRETDLLVTDLFPADVANGKHVLLIYTGETLAGYMAIKADKSVLLAEGRYEGQAREGIARRFGKLLSYPVHVIDNLLAQEKLLED
ncbi:MAG: hypothetical protein CMO98_00775 [Woeseia sp.]|nr:hypothetical protein [Woeseia sp.]